MHSRQVVSNRQFTNFSDNIRTPRVVRFSPSKTPRSGRKMINQSKEKSWDSTNSDLNRYKLSPEEIMRRKQVRSTPVNTGPILRSSIKKTKQPQHSAALTPSRTPVARDHSGNVTWVPTGRNTKARTPKTVNVQVNSPSSMENNFDADEQENLGIRPRVQSHHSSLSKVNKAWERSRIERSAAKKAAAAIAKAESEAKNRSLQINNVDINRLEQSFYELQGQLDKIRNMTGRPRTWCNINVRELGNEKNIVPYVETLGKTMKSICEMLSEHSIRVEQSEDDQKALQEAIVGVHTDMLRIRDEQERHAGVLEYLVAQHRANNTNSSNNNDSGLNHNNQVVTEETRTENSVNNNQQTENVVEAEEFDDTDGMQLNQFTDVEEADNYSPEFTQKQQLEEDAYAFEEMKKEIATFSCDELIQLLNSEGVRVDEATTKDNVEQLREMVLNIIKPDIASYAPPMPTPRSSLPETMANSNSNKIGRFSNYEAYMNSNDQ